MEFSFESHSVEIEVRGNLIIKRTYMLRVQAECRLRIISKATRQRIAMRIQFC